MCVGGGGGGGGQLIYIVYDMSIYNQYFGDTCPEQSSNEEHNGLMVEW